MFYLIRVPALVAPSCMIKMLSYATERPPAFTDYALLRMPQRGISIEEAQIAFAAPSSRHRHRRDGRSEARERIDGKRTLLVVYRRTADEIVVINAMWE